MNAVLKAHIEGLRHALEARSDGITIGQFRAGTQNFPLQDVSPMLEEFFRISNGGRFGSIDFWSAEELPKVQFRAADQPGGGAQWLEIGQLLYEPIFLHRANGSIRLPAFADCEASIVSDLDTFLGDYVFGRRYPELLGEGDDRWKQFLASAGRG